MGLLASRVVVCIVNHPKEGEFPPPGYSSEITWAAECHIPIVPFYDADRFCWKDVCNWKVDMPQIFRSGFNPVRYHRQAHEQAKKQLSSTIRQALAELDQPSDDEAGA